MFESDDFDQILSQFDFPDVSSDSQRKTEPIVNRTADKDEEPTNNSNFAGNSRRPELSNESSELINRSSVNVSEPLTKAISPKHTKRKIIDSFFDHKSKRKFPGPAGILNGSFKENKDDVVGHMELLSQDVDFSQNGLQRDSFDSPLWKRLLEDVKDWKLGVINTIKGIKQQDIVGNFRRRKADTITAFIEAVDRSITDPLITIRDCTGTIKGTLHRDAWSIFSPYIVSEYCALVLWKPTVLITGSAFKKHYLNITLSNIYAVYSSAVLNSEASKDIPDDYQITYEGEFTVIKADKSAVVNTENCTTASFGDSNQLFDGLDGIFDDEDF